MQQIWPTNSEIEIEDAYSIDSITASGFLRINMVSSIDGVISHEGRAKEFSSEIDQKVFKVMRTMADVILVGANTMKVEKYKSPNFTEEIQNIRESRGQQRIPPIAVVSSSANFDWESEFFTQASTKPIVFTTNTGMHAGSDFADQADFYNAGDSIVEVERVKYKLVDLGLSHILCEGGPTLNNYLLKDNLVDELCLTLSPKIAQGFGSRIFHGDGLEVPKDFNVKTLLFEEGQIFGRFTTVSK